MKAVFSILLLSMTFSVYSSLEHPVNQQTVFELNSKAGGWSSGGGNALVCFYPDSLRDARNYISRDGKLSDELFTNPRYIESIEMYDLFEAKLPRGPLSSNSPELIEISPDETLEEYLSRIALRFNKDISHITNTIAQGRDLIPDSNVRFFEGAITQNQDIGTTTINIKNNCVIATIAIQRSYNSFYELYIDSRAFNHPKHKRISKAALLLHEYIYSVARSRRENDSLTTRKLVEVSMTKHKTFTVNYLASLVTNLNFLYSTIPTGHKSAHLFAANAIHSPIWNLSLIAGKMRKPFNEYRTEAFSKFVKEMSQLNLNDPDPAGFRYVFEENITLQELTTIYIHSSSLFSAAAEEYYLKHLQTHLDQRALHLQELTKDHFNTILNSVSERGLSREDQDYIIEAIKYSYNNLIDLSRVLNPNIDSPFLEFIDNDNGYSNTQEIWARSLSLNTNLKLDYLIP